MNENPYRGPYSINFMYGGFCAWVDHLGYYAGTQPEKPTCETCGVVLDTYNSMVHDNTTCVACAEKAANRLGEM